MNTTITMFSIFLSVAKTKSFTKAAEQLFMTPQGVSKTISKLEEIMGFPLFFRSTRSVNLTSEGTEMFTFISDATEKYLDLVNGIRQELECKASVLRVGIMERLNIGNLIFKSTAEIEKETPRVQIEWTYLPGHSLETSLNRRELDIVISFAPGKPEQDNNESFLNRNAVEIATSQMLLLVSEKHPKLSEGADASTFNDEPLLLYRNSNSNSSPEKEIEEFTQMHKFQNYRPRHIRIMESEADAKLLVNLCKGVSVCSSLNIMSDEPSVKTFPLGDYSPIFCQWMLDNDKSLVHRLAELIVETAKSENNEVILDS